LTLDFELVERTCGKETDTRMDVLLIDDEGYIHRIIKQFFQRFGEENSIKINLRSLYDPVQGVLELSMAGNRFDVVVLDVRMPKLRGDEIYAYLMREKPHMLDDVLFMTGYRHDLDKHFPDQDLHVLEKPFHYRQFAESLTEMVA